MILFSSNQLTILSQLSIFFKILQKAQLFEETRNQNVST